MRLKLNEITTPTIQGEGIWIGRPTIFVRVQGCSVRCANCDTKKSWDPKFAKDLTITEITKILKPYPDIDVAVTGGEPLDPMHVDAVTALCFQLTRRNHRITIETSAMVPIPEEIGELKEYVDLWSVSPKLKGMRPLGQAEFNDDLFSEMTVSKGDVQLKFVIDTRHLQENLLELGEMLDGEVQCCVDHLVVQPMTRPNDGPKAILNAWAKLAKAVTTTPWLVKLRPQVIPQCHKLIGMV